MAYQPTVWAENDLISIERMNKLEQGVVAASEPPVVEGVMPVGGTANQMLVKASDTDYDAQWQDKPTYTAEEVGAVPATRTINGKALDADITLTASNVGARSSSWVPSPAQVGAIPADPVAAMSILTQAEYDALTTKDAATLYLIKE